VAAPNIESIVKDLAVRRPVFHSEADFQHALAWELHQRDATADVRLEKQVADSGQRVHLDLLVRGVDYEVAIELKYKTRAAQIVAHAETFALRNQSAQDIGRHDFIKDVHRLEQYVEVHPTAIGYAILLTNDRTYWSASKKSEAVDSQFRLHEGRSLHGTVTWGSGASDGTKRNRETALVLRGMHKIVWHDYSNPAVGNSSPFRFTVVRVANDG
jgi:hypothetical protein